MRRAAPVLAILSIATLSAQPIPAGDPIPQSLDEFQRAAARVLEDTRVPGAGLALVRQSGVEWAGGVGLADRERKLPVTADTGFRVGSVSKTFVAIGLVQLSEDGLLDLDAPVREVAPEVVIDNPWEDQQPVRVIHLLQHTAGFDDMHFNERYVAQGHEELDLAEVLRLSPRSRRVRWPPGTRMSYSNPGYAVAGMILENVAAMPYEDYIDREIFQPLQMTQSTFRLTADTERRLAHGYGSPESAAVGYPRIHLRPAGNMISTAHDLARFVQMLLGWGELGDAFVIDPEYLGNMEQPRTTLAAAAGLRNGYGTGLFSTLDLPYKVLGHSGGIIGFSASFAYSPSRDVGYVVLLNSSGAPAADAMRRLSALAISYLKRDVEAPQKPRTTVAREVLQRYLGYYHDANPRNQFIWPVQSLFSGREIVLDGDSLQVVPVVGERTPLIPVTETMFRLESDVEASRVFATDANGTMILTGPQLYAERTSRWPMDALRVGLSAAGVLIASVFVVAIAWVARLRRAQPRGFWELKLALLLCPIALLLPAAALALTPPEAWGVRSAATTAVYLGTLAIPTLALVVALFVVLAMRQRASRLLVTYAALVSLAMATVALFLRSHDMLGLRLWTY